MVITVALLVGFAGHDFQKAPHRNNPGVEPGSRKVFEITGHQPSGPGSLSTLKEDVVIRIGTCPDGFRRLDPKAFLTNDVECGVDYIFIAAESWTPDDSSYSAYTSPLMQS